MVVAGDEITMCRGPLDDRTARMFGVPDEAYTVDHWTEQYDHGSQTLHMTTFRTSAEHYAMVVWSLDPQISGEAVRLGMPPSLGMVVYGIGVLAEHCANDADAVAMGRRFAQLVAAGDLPWPPEDERDTNMWRLAATTVALPAL